MYYICIRVQTLLELTALAFWGTAHAWKEFGENITFA